LPGKGKTSKRKSGNRKCAICVRYILIAVAVGFAGFVVVGPCCCFCYCWWLYWQIKQIAHNVPQIINASH